MTDSPSAADEDANRVSLFRLPEYDEAFGIFLSDAMHGLAAAKDPVLAKVPRLPTSRMYRGRNSIPSTESNGTVDPPTLATRTDFSLSHDLIARGDGDELFGELDEIAEKYVSQVMPQLFEGLSMVTSAFGNAHDAGGKPFTWDMFLDMLEGMEVAFDDNDIPVPPSIYAGPDFQAPPDMSPEQVQRLEVILAGKRDAHIAGRRHRRILPDPLGG